MVAITNSVSSNNLQLVANTPSVRRSKRRANLYVIASPSHPQLGGKITSWLYKERVAVFVAVVFFVVFGALLFVRDLQTTALSSSNEPVAAHSLDAANVGADGSLHRVESGETIWDIANGLTDGDPRNVMYELIEVNGSEDIFVGQDLFIPSSIQG